jgi:hypothetical protein
VNSAGRSTRRRSRCIARLRVGGGGAAGESSPRLREGIAALRPRRELSLAVVVLAVAMTITTGSWIAGVPTFVRDTLHRGPGGFSVVMTGFALGAVAVGAVLARIRVRAKARASMLAWLIYLPAYGLIAVTGGCRCSWSPRSGRAPARRSPTCC